MPPTGGIKIVCEANLGSLGSLGSLAPAGQVISELGYGESQMAEAGPKLRTYTSLDTGGWAGGVATLLPPPGPHPNTFPPCRSVTPERAGRGGGRRLKQEPESSLDPEEEERRRVRRERNKLAAARCRKRRVDQIESLQRDVEEWEERKRLLQEEIVSLQQQREEFQFILEAHRHSCRRLEAAAQLPVTSAVSGPRVVTVKTEPELEAAHWASDPPGDSLHLLPLAPAPAPAPRPVSLSLKSVPLGCSLETGVSLDTPSAHLSLEALLEAGGRGALTPITSGQAEDGSVAASCGSQQRHGGISLAASMSELSSPASSAPNLVSL